MIAELALIGGLLFLRKRAKTHIEGISGIFRSGKSSDEIFEALEELYGSSDAVNIISQLEDRYGGELIECSYNALNSINEGGIPFPAPQETFYVKNGEYHHFAFKDGDGEIFVETIPFR